MFVVPLCGKGKKKSEKSERTKYSLLGKRNRSNMVFYIMDYYTGSKRNELDIYASTWVDLKKHMQIA